MAEGIDPRGHGPKGTNRDGSPYYNRDTGEIYDQTSYFFQDEVVIAAAHPSWESMEDCGGVPPRLHDKRLWEKLPMEKKLVRSPKLSKLQKGWRAAHSKHSGEESTDVPDDVALADFSDAPSDRVSARSIRVDRLSIVSRKSLKVFRDFRGIV